MRRFFYEEGLRSFWPNHFPSNSDTIMCVCRFNKWMIQWVLCISIRGSNRRTTKAYVCLYGMLNTAGEHRHPYTIGTRHKGHSKCLYTHNCVLMVFTYHCTWLCCTIHIRKRLILSSFAILFSRCSMGRI